MRDDEWEAVLDEVAELAKGRPDVAERWQLAAASADMSPVEWLHEAFAREADRMLGTKQADLAPSGARGADSYEQNPNR